MLIFEFLQILLILVKLLNNDLRLFEYCTLNDLNEVVLNSYIINLELNL